MRPLSLRERRRDESGFSLIELIVTMAVASMIMTSFVAFMISSQRTSAQVTDSVSDFGTIRVAVAAVTRDIRTASRLPLNTVDAPFVVAQEDRTVFYANLGGIDAPVRIEIVRDATDQLITRVWDPIDPNAGEWDATNFPALSDVASASTRFLTQEIVNEAGAPVFEYYRRQAGSDALELLVPPDSTGLTAQQRNEVVAVGIHLRIQHGQSMDELPPADVDTIVRLPNMLI